MSESLQQALANVEDSDSEMGTPGRATLDTGAVEHAVLDQPPVPLELERREEISRSAHDEEDEDLDEGLKVMPHMEIPDVF